MRTDDVISGQFSVYERGIAIPRPFILFQVRSLRSCLEDSAVLVQRNTLDILSLAFPFHCTQLTQRDQCGVVAASLQVLLRRDMSLNRRLYAWLLGITTTGKEDLLYEYTALNGLIRILRKLSTVLGTVIRAELFINFLSMP